MIVGANEVMAIILALLITIPGCLGAGDGTDDGVGGAGDGAGGGELITLVVWSTFEADSLEDEVFSRCHCHF